ncbi:MAG: branched-chain amino acid ABC transporter permease [Armatimonadota bacterium]|nr:branched-chain amino acid ABC transporter permease [Armatimonadota bacterium]MDR5697771.1 branched-chain amino acid ABC transporter permease [Armatimonadota bacterium]
MNGLGRALPAVLLLVFAVLGSVLPGWLVFVLTLALAKGLVVLAVVVLMRAGLVSFGHGLFFAGAAYAAGFATRAWEVKEALLLILLGVAVAVALGAVFGLLAARYREIFFAMLSLAFSMVLYGVLIKAYTLTGGSDGLRIPVPTILGVVPQLEQARLAIYYVALAAVAVAVALIRRYSAAPLGYLMQAVRDNEVRVGYLGASVNRAIYLTYVLSAALGGLGGVLVALNVGHIDPNLAYWTTSGEFVFIALLGGTEGVLAPLAGAIVYELFKSYAFKYAPYAWQMMMGGIMLAIILFLPGGLWAPIERALRRTR